MRFGVALSLAAALCAASVAGAASGGDARVRPGVGIARIDLGMTQAQVRQRLGRPGSVIRRSRGFGRVYVEQQFDDGWFSVGLFGRPGSLRVVRVATVHPTERTPQGFGVGTTERRLAATFRGKLRCARLVLGTFVGHTYVKSPTRECVVRSASGTAETVFVTAIPPRLNEIALEPAKWRPRARVLEMVVRSAGVR